MFVVINMVGCGDGLLSLRFLFDLPILILGGITQVFSTGKFLVLSYVFIMYSSLGISYVNCAKINQCIISRWWYLATRV